MCLIISIPYELLVIFYELLVVLPNVLGGNHYYISTFARDKTKNAKSINTINNMKKLFLLSLMAIFVITMSAQSVALEHEGASTIFYGGQSLAQAYAQAVDGDVLYLSGGSYGDLTVEKKLKIYGTGVNPNNTEVTGISQLATIYVNAAGTESHIEGIKANAIRLNSAENVTIRYCHVGEVEARLSHNLLMYNNIVWGAVRLGDTCRMDRATQLSTGCVISNNYIHNGLHRCRENTIKNNIFRRRGVGDDFNSYSFGLVATACVVENNIFTLSSGGYGGWYSGENTMRKNITYLGSEVNNYCVGTGKDAEIFVDYDDDNFTFDKNYHLNEPTTYVGTDDTEVGLYGGLFPWNEDVMPSNPHIMSNTSGTKTNSEGKLLLNIKVSAQ